MRTELLTLHSDGSATVSGIDYGPMQLWDIVQRSGEIFLVCKVKSRKVWSGRGSQRTDPTHFNIFPVVEECDGTQFRVASAIRFNTSGPSQRALEQTSQVVR